MNDHTPLDTKPSRTRRASRRTTRTRDCPSCERTGLLPFSGGQSAVACPTCRGRGEVSA